MPRSYPTVDQRRSNAAFANSRSSYPVGKKSGSVKDGYTNAAKKLWQLSDDWEVNLLMNLFGPERMGSIAAAFDPAFKFRAGAQKIDVARRRRTREQGSSSIGYTVEGHVVTTKNFIYVSDEEDVFEIVSPYEEVDDPFEEFVMPQSQLSHTTFMEDSTDALRAKDAPFSEMESCQLYDLEWDPHPAPFTVNATTTVNYPDSRTESSVSSETVTWSGDGPIVPIVRNWGTDEGLESLNASIKQFCADHLEDYLPQCLTNKRLFNAFYQLGELKDLPLMIEKTLATRNFLLDLIKNPKTALERLDKASGDAYLNYLFGYKSLNSAIKSLLKLPERAAKRFNYLLRKNAKVTSQRFKLVFNDPNLMGEISPAWSYVVPSPYNAQDNAKVVQNLELRAVVNSTIDFPELAVPKYSDSNFRDIIGLNPRVTDIYNLIPWTWLGDWFVGVSKYLNLVESLLLDKDLINVGFVTVIYDVNFELKGNLTVYQTASTTYDFESGDIVSQTQDDELVMPYRTAGKMKYRVRFSISDLLGVKSVDDKQGLLSESQKSILGALFTKFT